MRGAGRLLPCCLFSLGWRRVRLVSVLLARPGLDGLGLRGVGWEEGMRSPLALIPEWGFCRRLHGCFRVAAREVGELAFGLRGVGWPWQCGRAVVERVVEVVVPHGLGLPDPGLCGFECVWAAGGSLSPVDCCLDRFPRGAFAARECGGLEESLPASWGVLRVFFWGVGLGRH